MCLCASRCIVGRLADKHPLKGSRSGWHFSAGTLFVLEISPPHAFNNSAGSFFFSLLTLDTMPTFPTSGLNIYSPSLPQKTQTEELHIKDIHKAELFVSCAVRLYRAWVTLRPHCLCLERWAFTGNVSLLFFIQNVS